MLLFQRVKRIANEIAGSETKLAAILDMRQRTLNGYLNESRQDNLWPVLPRILQALPQISREWLYFDEGEMLASQGGWKAAMPIATGKQAAPKTESRRVCELEAEISRLRQELIESKDKIITLYEQQYGGRFLEYPSNTGDAPISPPAVRSER